VRAIARSVRDEQIPSVGQPDLDPLSPFGGTDVLEKEELAPNNDGDHERFAHYVRKEKIT